TVRHQVDGVRNGGQALVRQVRRRPTSDRGATQEPAVRPRPAAEPRPARAAEAEGAAQDGESTIRAAQSMVGRTMQEAQRRAAEQAEQAELAEQEESHREAMDEHRAEVAGARAEAEQLAIPDYESLSAAQVNARLSALTP